MADSGILARILGEGPLGNSFMGAYQGAIDTNVARGLHEAQTAGALSQIQARAMEQQKAQREMALDERRRAVLAQTGGDPQKAIQVLLQSGDPEGAAKLAPLLRPQQQGQAIGSGGLRLPDGTIVPPVQRPVVERPTAIGSGGLRLPDGTVVPPVERPQQDRKLLPNQKVRDRIVGNSIVQEELQPDGSYLEIGRGPRFAKSVTSVNLPAERDTPHAIVGVTPEGNQTINWARPSQGNQTFGSKSPSLLTTENVRERQMSTSLEATKKPHLDVLNAYQRYEEIKGTGDNSQANQFLAQQLMQMSKTGQRVIPKAELERILGSGDLGNDWIGRASNMISQMASGVRTPTIDKRLNDLADAMGKGSAERIGQEIQNTIARTPAGVDSARIVGTKPTIYGRFIITPSGKVHTFKSSAEAQAKLQEAAQRVGQ